MIQDLTANIRVVFNLFTAADPQFLKSVEKALEIGCFHGTTTNLMVDFFRQHSPTFQHVLCLDPWDDDYQELGNVPWYPNWKGQYETFLKNTERNTNFRQIMRGKSQITLPTLPCEPTFDFAYIDGDHTEEGTYIDAINTLPRMKKGGYILFDDYLWGDYIGQPELTPKRAVERFVEENKGKVEVVYSDYQLMVRVL